MIKSKKIQFFLLVLLIIIISVIVGRHFVTKHFVKKFSKMPPPGVIVNSVSKSTFYESIETFGTALSLKNKNYRIFFQVPSSILISSVGLYWFFERINLI